MVFEVDERIKQDSIWIADSELSTIYIKNDSNFLWFILVPRVENCQEIYQLSEKDQSVLIKEISKLSQLVSLHYKPDKLNVGALGNMVSQLHVHIVARKKTDITWPYSVWQPGLVNKAYDKDYQLELTNLWRQQLMDSEFFNPK